MCLGRLEDENIGSVRLLCAPAKCHLQRSDLPSACLVAIVRMWRRLSVCVRGLGGGGETHQSFANRRVACFGVETPSPLLRSKIGKKNYSNSSRGFKTTSLLATSADAEPLPAFNNARHFLLFSIVTAAAGAKTAARPSSRVKCRLLSRASDFRRSISRLGRRSAGCCCALC